MASYFSAVHATVGQDPAKVIERRGRMGLVGMLAIVAAGGLSACSNSETASGPQCPRVGIIGDAGSVTKFREGPGRDPTDIAYEVKLGPISGDCAYAGNRSKVSVSVKLPIVAARGPADPGVGPTVSYFVAVVAPDQRVLAREEFSRRIEVPSNQARAGVVEELEEIMPLKSGQDGSALQVLIGLNLSADELARNRAATAKFPVP